MTSQQGENNTFHGNTIIATKGIKIGNGPVMKKFINWTDVSSTVLPSPDVGPFVSSQLAYNQIGDQVHVLFDFVFPTINGAALSLIIPDLPEVANGIYSHNVLVEVDGIGVQDATITINSAVSPPEMIFAVQNFVVLAGQTLIWRGEFNYTTTN